MLPSFYHPDPTPGVALSSMAPSSAKVRSWFSRSVERTGFPLDREVQISGAIDILEGLEYHHSQFMSQLAPLKSFLACVGKPMAECPTPPPPTPEESQALYCLQHEAVAYVNRLGQLYYFAKSVNISGHVVKTEALLPFRRKYSAHRSVDMPRNESVQEREAQARAFGFHHLFIGGKVVFQIPADGTHHHLNIQDDHPIVISQAVEMFTAIYPLPADA